MHVIDSYEQILRAFPDGRFSMDAWRAYARAISPSLAAFAQEDLSKYDFEGMVLPVVQAALRAPEKLAQAHDGFLAATGRIGAAYAAQFPEPLDVDVVFYLGLCSGAGCAERVSGRLCVLLGVEKIVELDWGSEEQMFALLAHELGHCWHMQVGGCFGTQRSDAERAIFQLYSEGVAMAFEQALYGGAYYHQDRDGWLDWCRANENQIKAAYLRRVEAGESVQDFFGDWCAYQGHSDVGYYLGCRFVRYLLAQYPRLEMARLCNADLLRAYRRFAEAV